MNIFQNLLSFIFILLYLQQYQLERNNASFDRAIKSFHEAVWLKDEISVFIYFIDTSENKAKPILLLKKLNEINGQINFLNSYIKIETVFENTPYTFSDIENSLAIFNDYYFSLASITESNENFNKYLIISLLNIFNSDKSIHTHYLSFHLKIYMIQIIILDYKLWDIKMVMEFNLIIEKIMNIELDLLYLVMEMLLLQNIKKKYLKTKILIHLIF